MAQPSPRRSRKTARVPVPTTTDFRRHLLAHADEIAPADVATLAGAADRIHARLAGDATPDEKFAHRVRLAVAIVGDHAGGRCPQIPYRTVSLLAAALFYYLNPIDVIPDAIPGAGRADDALVLDLAWELGRAGIERYISART
jgi:uncharacterized membrane protein YkvA (DUF1232 family)